MASTHAQGRRGGRPCVRGSVPGCACSADQPPENEARAQRNERGTKRINPDLLFQQPTPVRAFQLQLEWWLNRAAALQARPGTSNAVTCSSDIRQRRLAN